MEIYTECIHNVSLVRLIKGDAYASITFYGSRLGLWRQSTHWLSCSLSALKLTQWVLRSDIKSLIWSESTRRSRINWHQLKYFCNRSVIGRSYQGSAKMGGVRQMIDKKVIWHRILCPSRNNPGRTKEGQKCRIRLFWMRCIIWGLV